jgi:pyroglutamyl-peptidase
MPTPRVLVTAFEPYGPYPSNASSAALDRIEAESVNGIQLATRRYPVDFARIAGLVADDLAEGYDIVLHLGQAPGRGRLDLEAVALNLGCEPAQRIAEPLAHGLPLAYRSALPLDRWAARLVAEGHETAVSYHAGLYLCNACLFWSLHTSLQLGLPTRSAFVHIPPSAEQTPHAAVTWPTEESAAAVRSLLKAIAEEHASGFLQSRPAPND